VSQKKVITRETAHTQFTDDVIMNANLRKNGWSRGNPLVEKKRGKAYRGLALSMQKQLEEDNKEEE
jgi:hypothetical protein